MKKRYLILVPIISAVVPLAAVPQAAEAKGCVKGAAVGAVAGRVARHHTVLGAIVGCVIGHHRANRTH